LTAKSPIPSVDSALFSAHKDAVNGSGIANDAPWIIYIRVGFPRCGNDRTQDQSGSHRFFMLLSSLVNVQIWSADFHVGEAFDLTKKLFVFGNRGCSACESAFGLREVTVSSAFRLRGCPRQSPDQIRASV
jgi:hypothetical protein